MNNQKTSYAVIFVRVLSAISFIMALLITLQRGIPADKASVMIYLVLPLIIGTVLLGLSFLHPEKVKISIAVFLPILVGAYSAEIYLQFFDVSSKGYPAKERKKQPIQYLLDLRNEGVDAYPMPGVREAPTSKNIGAATTAAIWKNDELITTLPSGLLPLGAIANKTFVYCNEEGDFEKFLADEYGFNNPQGLWDKKDIDFALVGDSFTMGVCVPADKHFSTMIRNRFPLTVNLGRLNSGPLFQLGTIKEYLPALRPKTTLWFFLEDNDIHGDMRDELKSAVFRKYVEEKDFTQNLINSQETIDREYMQMLNEAMNEWEAQKNSVNTPSAAARPRFDYKKLVAAAKLTHIRGMLGLGSDPAFAAETKMLLQTYEQILRQGQATVNSWGGKIILVYLPSHQRFSSIRARFSTDKHRQEIIEIARNVGIPVIDVVPAFESHPDPITLFQGHYTREGYALLGNTLLKQLEK